jgi:sporulation-control protein spo0M
VTDVGPDIACNSLIDSTEISTSGTRNLDFNLTPETQWPVGMYRVEVYVNGELDTVKEFRVQ